MNTNNENEKEIVAVKNPPLRFDIFKGVNTEGHIQKVESVGTAVLYQGLRGYQIFLDSFSKEVFHLFPSRNSNSPSQFVIMARKPPRRPGQRPVWRMIGEAKIISTQLGGTLNLSFDLLAVPDIYMTMAPIGGCFEVEMIKTLKEVAAS